MIWRANWTTGKIKMNLWNRKIVWWAKIIDSLRNKYLSLSRQTKLIAIVLCNLKMTYNLRSNCCARRWTRSRRSTVRRLGKVSIKLSTYLIKTQSSRRNFTRVNKPSLNMQSKQEKALTIVSLPKGPKFKKAARTWVPNQVHKANLCRSRSILIIWVQKS